MNDDTPKPMLNTPIENGVSAGEEFAQNVLGRMNRVHGAFDVNQTLAVRSEEERERREKWKHEIIQRFSEFSGLEFDQDGRCTTQVTSEKRRQVQKHWVELSGKLTAEQDPQKKEQLWRQAGAILRGEAEAPEDSHG